MRKHISILLLMFSIVLFSTCNYIYGQEKSDSAKTTESQSTSESKNSTEAPASTEGASTEAPQATETPTPTGTVTPTETPTPTPTSVTPVLKGLQLINGKIYFYENGKPFTGGLKKVYSAKEKNGYYYFTKDGSALTKTLKKVKIKDKDYYFYFDKKGRAVTEKWKKISGDQYYFGKKGRAFTGYHQISNLYCKFDSEGVLVRKIDCDKKVIALTYDDGPSIQTPALLDTLEKYDAVATFFVVGNRVSTYSDTVERAYEMNCEIGNHTYTHQYLTKVGSKAVKDQIIKTNKAVKKITGKSPKVMRPPGGFLNDNVLSNINMPAIVWSVDTLDWKTRNTSKTVTAVLNNPKDGDVVLMHDLYEPTVNAAEKIIPALQKDGFQLVTISELAACRDYKLKAGKRYGSFYKKKK